MRINVKSMMLMAKAFLIRLGYLLKLKLTVGKNSPRQYMIKVVKFLPSFGT